MVHEQGVYLVIYILNDALLLMIDRFDYPFQFRLSITHVCN